MILAYSNMFSKHQQMKRLKFCLIILHPSYDVNKHGLNLTPHIPTPVLCSSAVDKHSQDGKNFNQRTSSSQAFTLNSHELLTPHNATLLSQSCFCSFRHAQLVLDKDKSLFSLGKKIVDIQKASLTVPSMANVQAALALSNSRNRSSTDTEIAWIQLIIVQVLSTFKLWGQPANCNV
ncbi:hypothetical protein VP01_48g2 [Puccinia sorghi]|uniref:Uncharacterized protein n=1 Tax=Puccinia sorghi TaxID=27349 RepID=A0A0L6UMV5_9BASI|nr:hypothetical protein VP01_48g2 [Puccinia sorghi]